MTTSPACLWQEEGTGVPLRPGGLRAPTLRGEPIGTLPGCKPAGWLLNSRHVLVPCEERERRDKMRLHPAARDLRVDRPFTLNSYNWIRFRS
jgi:hypothetical protein